MTDWRETVGNSSKVFPERQTGVQTGQAVSAGRIALSGASVTPSNVSPGGLVRVNLQFDNNAGFISPTDPALCDPEEPPLEGLRISVTASPSWTSSQTQIECVPSPLFGVFGGVEMQFNMSAPELPDGVTSSEETIDITFAQDGKPDTQVSTTLGLTVSSSGLDEPQNGDDGGSGSGAAQFILENPVEAGILGIAGVVAIRSATEAMVGGG